MSKFVFVLVLGLILLSGCTSIIRDDCPARFIVRKTDRVRCYEEELDLSNLDTANIITFGLVCGMSGLNCIPQKVLEERTCPNACIQAYKNGGA